MSKACKLFYAKNTITGEIKSFLSTCEMLLFCGPYEAIREEGDLTRLWRVWEPEEGSEMTSHQKEQWCKQDPALDHQHHQDKLLKNFLDWYSQWANIENVKTQFRWMADGIAPGWTCSNAMVDGIWQAFKAGAATHVEKQKCAMKVGEKQNPAQIVYKLGVTGGEQQHETILSTELTREEALETFERWQQKEKSLYQRMTVWKKVEDGSKDLLQAPKTKAVWDEVFQVWIEVKI